MKKKTVMEERGEVELFPLLLKLYLWIEERVSRSDSLGMCT